MRQSLESSQSRNLLQIHLHQTDHAGYLQISLLTVPFTPEEKLQSVEPYSKEVSHRTMP